MKAIAEVDVNGLYVEDVIVDDNVYGVIPVYEQTSIGATEGTQDKVITGYQVAVSVPQGLFHPKWDIKKYKWIEGLSPEKIEELKKEPEVIPVDSDLDGRLKKQESTQAQQSKTLEEVQAELVAAKELNDLIGQQLVQSDLDKAELNDQLNQHKELLTQLNEANAILGQQVVHSDLEKQDLLKAVNEQATQITEVKNVNNELKELTETLSQRLTALESK
jgi:hypothetical protein